jgi:hypothetical protein
MCTSMNITHTTQHTAYTAAHTHARHRTYAAMMPMTLAIIPSRSRFQTYASVSENAHTHTHTHTHTVHSTCIHNDRKRHRRVYLHTRTRSTHFGLGVGHCAIVRHLHDASVSTSYSTLHKLHAHTPHTSQHTLTYRHNDKVVQYGDHNQCECRHSEANERDRYDKVEQQLECCSHTVYEIGHCETINTQTPPYSHAM